jgi:hypothetical protein
MINKKLGYYTVGSIDFDSKINALIHAIQTGEQPQWHFNDNEYRAYDWTTEPAMSLDELYDQRVRQLREQYDYLILSYSGGADSHNILTSFIRQGIHIDEIVVNTMEKGNKKSTTISKNNVAAENAAAEHDLQTMPRLKEASQLIPNTKITICDLTDYLFDYLEGKGDESWVFDKREGLNPAGMTRFNYLHFSDIRKRFDKDKSIGIVMGIEKPRCFIHQNRFIVSYSDRATNITTVAEHFKEYTNSTIEFFYWSPEALDLQCKQVHTIKKWLEAFPQYRDYWDAEKGMDFTTVRLVHERLLRTVLYTTWNNTWYQSDKALSDWYSEFDSWFFDDYENTNAYHIWKLGIDYVSTTLGNFVKETPDGKKDGLTVFSKRYLIGEMKPVILL